MKKQNSHLFYKLGFLLMGFGVLLRLGRMLLSFDYEETYSVITSNPNIPLGQIIKDWLIVDVHPPLYNILLWCWNHLVPYPHEVWTRFFSLLITAFSLLAAYFLFPVRYGKTARFLFLGCVAIMWHNVYYGTYARSYVLLLLTSIVVILSSLKILDCFKNSTLVPKKEYFLFFVAGTVGAWTHYFGLLLFAVCVFLLFLVALHFKQKVFPLLAGSVIVFLIAGIWVVPNFLHNWQVGHFGGKWWANEELTLFDSLWYFYQFFFGVPLLGSLFAVGVLLLASYYYKKARTNQYFPYTLDCAFCIGIFLLVLLGAGIISIKTFLFIPRFFIVSFPALYILFSILLAPLVAKNRWIFVSVLVFWAFTLGISWKDFAWSLGKEPDSGRNVAEYFMKNRTDDKTELYVLMKDAYPVAAQEAMMSLYINDYFKQNVSVTVLNNLSKEERAKKLQNKNAIFVVPMCYPLKVDKISAWMGERYFLKKNMNGFCEVTPDRNESNPIYDPESKSFSLF